MKLAWGAKVSKEFCSRVLGMAYRLGMDPNWLMAIMAFETGRTFNPACRNPLSNAIGLIQFMPSTASALGLSTAELARMSAEDQLGQVEIYFRPHAQKGFDSLADAYMAVLWPAAVTQNDDYILFSGGDAYAQNKGLDINNDHNVSKKEAAAYVEKALEEGLKEGNYREVGTQQAAPIEERGIPYNPEQEAPMPAPALMFVPAILEAIPALISALGKGERAEKNAKAAEVIVSKFKEAVPDALNAQDALEKVQSNPSLLAEVKAKVLSDPAIVALMEVGGGVQEARRANVALVQASTKWWQLVFNPVLVVTFAVLPLVYKIVWELTPYLAKVTSDVIAQTIGTIIGLVLGGTIGFWFGQTYQQNIQRRTTDNGVQS